MRRAFGPGRRQQQISLPILLLGMQIMRAGFDRIPPVTLVTLLGQVAVFLRLLPFRLPSIQQACVSAVNVWYYEDYQRLILAPFFHASDWHLYYNMASFLWKGISLEHRLGSAYFAYMIAVFSLLTSALMVGMGMGAEQALHDQSYLYQCGVGFSGVLFALKVVTTHMMPRGTQYIMGWIPVNSRYACWVELIVIHIMVPHSSFMGHLAGILVGLAYVKGPLKFIMDIPASMVPAMAPGPSYTYRSGSSGYQSQPRTNRQGPRRAAYPETYAAGGGGGASGYANPTAPSYGWAAGAQYNGHANSAPPYTGGLSEEEQVAQAMRQSMNDFNNHSPRSEPSAPPAYDDSAPPPYEEIDQHHRIPPPRPGGLYPDLGAVDAEEVRRRRLQRFQ